MSARSRAALAAAAMSAAACFTSPAPERLGVAAHPGGARTQVQLADRTWRTGELLAVDEQSLVLFVGDRLVVVPRGYAEGVMIDGVGVAGRQSGSRGLVLRSDVASWARFPTGIPADALAALLRETRQAAPDTLRPRRK